MSANPRSPESGDVPEEGTAVMLRGHEYVYTNLGYGESWYSRSERRGFVSPTSELAIALTAIASLTAELSTARERADRAEQENARRKPVFDAAVAVMDQLCSFNRVTHPEVVRRLVQLQYAFAAYYSTPTPTPDHA